MSAPTEIWWCEEHRASGWGGGRAKWCHLAPATDEKSDNYQCRVVSRRLVDPSALVLLRDEEGNWPQHAIDVLRYDVAALAETGAVQILDALAVASKEGKT